MAAFDTTSWLNTHNPTAGPVSDLGGRWPAHGDPSGSALSDEGATHQVTVGFGKARERCWKANWWVGPLNLPQFSESHLGLQLLRPLTAGDTNSIKRARMADRDDRSSVPPGRKPVGDATCAQRIFVGIAEFQQFDTVLHGEPIDVTGTFARRLSTSLAIEFALYFSSNSTVSSKTVLPSFSSEGIDL